MSKSNPFKRCDLRTVHNPHIYSRPVGVKWECDGQPEVMCNWQYEIKPEEHPEDITVVSLHCGDSLAEMADSQYAWIVETNKELRTVLEVLDEVIAEGGDDVMYTILFVPKKKTLDPSVIRDQAEAVLDID